MFTDEERTEERAAAYVEALKTERKGYEARATIVKQGGNDKGGLSGEQLADRIAHVDAEIKRMSPSSGGGSEAEGFWRR